MVFQYYHDIKNGAWVVTFDGYEITRFMTEKEASDYCDYENDQMVNQSIARG